MVKFTIGRLNGRKDKRKDKIMASKVIFTVRDYSDEMSSVAFPITDLDEANWLATQTQITAVQTALAALSIGTIAKRTVIAEDVKVNDVRPVDPNAQRENGLRLFYQDVVTQKRYHLTVPCPDKVAVAQGGTDEVDLTGVSVVNAIVTALEVFMKSPEGNAVTFYRGRLVGRRN